MDDYLSLRGVDAITMTSNIKDIVFTTFSQFFWKLFGIFFTSDFSCKRPVKGLSHHNSWALTPPPITPRQSRSAQWPWPTDRSQSGWVFFLGAGLFRGKAGGGGKSYRNGYICQPAPNPRTFRPPPKLTLTKLVPTQGPPISRSRGYVFFWGGGWGSNSEGGGSGRIRTICHPAPDPRMSPFPP